MELHTLGWCQGWLDIYRSYISLIYIEYISDIFVRKYWIFSIFSIFIEFLKIFLMWHIVITFLFSVHVFCWLITFLPSAFSQCMCKCSIYISKISQYFPTRWPVRMVRCFYGVSYKCRTVKVWKWQCITCKKTSRSSRVRMWVRFRIRVKSRLILGIELGLVQFCHFHILYRPWYLRITTIGQVGKYYCIPGVADVRAYFTQCACLPKFLLF